MDRKVLSAKIAAGLLVAAFSGAALAQTEIRYALWDSLQLPAYRACADAFEKQNPNIKIKIDQVGWSDYWTTLTTQMVTGEAWDVFTNHLSRLPTFVEQKQLLDIAPLVARDKVDLSMYFPKSLVGQWTYGNARYGLPKDIGSEAIYYNLDALKAAKIDPSTLNTLTWNPTDGGSFERLIARLSLDQNGNNGLSPNFDKTKVKQYGFSMNLPDWNGQTGWGSFAASIGFKIQDKPYAGRYNYDDPRFLQTIDWWKRLVDKGFAPPFADLASNGIGQGALFKAGRLAAMDEGNWNINDHRQNKFPITFGLMPRGSAGSKTIVNGLADSIYARTKHPEEAWQWMKFLASPTCAEIVGRTGVVFPAQKNAVQLSVEAAKKSGIDLSTFVRQQELGTWQYPIDFKTAEVSAIMNPVLQNYLQNKATAQDVMDAAKKVNALFK